jgi:hypothetical protein
MNDYSFSISMHPNPELGMSLVLQKEQDMMPYRKRLIEKKKNYLEVAELFHDQEYREWIEKAFLQTEKTLLWLFQSNYTQNEIAEKFDVALEKFSNHCLEYLRQSSDNDRAMQATADKLSMVDRMITNIKASSPPPLSTEEYLKKLDANPFYGILRMQQEEKAAVGQLGAMAVEVAVTAAKTMCNLTPGTKKACQATLDFGKKTVDALAHAGLATLDSVCLKEPFEKIRDKVHAADDRTLKIRNFHLYGISEEITAKQIENSHFIPFGLVVPGASVKTAIAFWKRVQAVKKAELIFEIPAQVNRNIPAIFLPHLGHNLYTPIIPRQIEASALVQSQIARHSHSAMGICFEEEALQKIIPTIPSKGTRQETWLSMIYPGEKLALQEASINYFGDRGSRLAKVDYKGISVVIKSRNSAVEISQEVCGLHTFQRLGLKHLETPIPIAVGQIERSHEFFIAKSYVHGTPFDYLLEAIGPSSQSFHLREEKLQDFFAANFHAGKAFGELHTKSTQAASLSNSMLSHLTEPFLERLETVRDAMSEIGSLKSWTFNASSPEVKRLISEFKQNPGPLCYGIDDISGSQFTWNPHSSGAKVGLVDLEFVPWTYTLDKKPLMPISREFHDFIITIENEGLAHGLSLNELQYAKSEFTKGYFSTYRGPEHSVAASRFYEIERSLMSIESLAYGISRLGEEIDRAALSQLILRTKQLFE